MIDCTIKVKTPEIMIDYFGRLSIISSAIVKIAKKSEGFKKDFYCYYLSIKEQHLFKETCDLIKSIGIDFEVIDEPIGLRFK